MHDPVKHIIMCTLGTRGDIVPFVALAAALRRWGARVTVLSNHNWKGLVTAVGADFVPISPADPSQSGRDEKAFFKEYTLPSYQASYDFVVRNAHPHEQIVLVGRSQMLGIEVAALRLKLPHVTIALQPSAVASCLRPPWPLTPLALGPTGPIGSRVLIPSIYRLGEWLSPYRKAAATFRRINGSSLPLRSMPPRLPGNLVAMLCPEWFAMPALDWQRNLQFFGFPFDTIESHDAATGAISFLQSGPPAIVATPGTGVTDVDRFVAQLIAVARERGMRLLLVSPNLTRFKTEDQVMACSFLPLQHVLPHASILVHHGGIGTVGAAIAAGCPQLVLAGRFDQPDNGVRVAQLGLGGAILRSMPSVEMIGEAVDRIRESKYVNVQVRSAAKQVRSFDAIAELASKVIEL